MDKSLVLLALLALSACGHVNAYKQDATSEQAQKDKSDCTYEAHHTVVPVANPLIARSQFMKMTSLCLQKRGYTVSN